MTDDDRRQITVQYFKRLDGSATARSSGCSSTSIPTTPTPTAPGIPG
jgi:hypothetical protein